MTRTVAASAPIALSLARPLPAAGTAPQCPLCGTDWDPNCPNATPPTWDPTRGVTSTTWQPIGGRR